MRLTVAALGEHQALLIDVGYDCRYWELYNQHGIRLLQCSVETAVAKSKYKRSAVHTLKSGEKQQQQKISSRDRDRERERKKGETYFIRY